METITRRRKMDRLIYKEEKPVVTTKYGKVRMQSCFTCRNKFDFKSM